MMEHLCHAFECVTPVPPEKLMCLRHWRMVPKDVQIKVSVHYRPGQCNDKRPSKEWFYWAKTAISAVAVREKKANQNLRIPYETYLELKELKDFSGL